MEKIGQSGGASQWRVCYQRGLPRLVLFQTGYVICNEKDIIHHMGCYMYIALCVMCHITCTMCPLSCTINNVSTPGNPW